MSRTLSPHGGFQMRFPQYLTAVTCLAASLAIAPAVAAHENFSADPQAAAFAQEMEQQHGFPAADVLSLLADARFLDEVIERISKPAEALAWSRYRKIFLTEDRIANGVEFWREHAATLARAEQKFGVDARYIVAIIGVETAYGHRKGRLRVLDALATLAFGYPRRSSFFRRELEEFLLLARDENLPAREILGSYAGAMGVPQFIASSYRAYAVDFDGDGVRDLIGSVDDAIGSVANYLAVHGWQRGAQVAVPAAAPASVAAALLARGNRPEMTLAELAAAGVDTDSAVADGGKAALISLDGEQGDELWIVFANFYAITRYNPSNLYAMAVTQLADAIADRRSAAGNES